MPSNTPQRERPRPRRASAAPALVSLAAALLCFAHVALAQESQSPQPQAGAPAAAPTPYVRPRTVGPKADPAPTPGPPAAAPDSGEAVDEDEVVRVESNLVLIPASVVDGSGRAVADLRLEDFELQVDGEPRPISDLSRAETPVNIALLFDNSQSLSAAREFEKQAALRFFRAIVRPIDRAAIYSISTQPKLEQGFTNNVGGLVRTIENFGPPAGATALFDTVALAADHIRHMPGRKVLVLVSDGSDTLSDLSFDDALTRTLRAECQIYVVQTRQIEDPSLNDIASEQTMRKLAEQTGGAVFSPRSVEDLDAAFRQISLDISQQYVLSYNPQDERPDNYFRFIKVNVKGRPHFRVRARKGFYPHGGQAGAEPPDEVAAARTARPAAPAPTQTASRNGARGAKTSTRAAAREKGAGRVGPAAPDEEERPRPTPPELEESQPTLTLTVAENGSAPRRPDADLPRPTPSPSPSPTPSEPAESAPEETAEERPAAGEAGKPDAPKRSHVSGGVLNSKALNLPRPAYPPFAKSAGVSGTVTVEVTIDERGNVTEVRAVSGPAMLYQAAVAAARQAKFSPTTLSGEPVKVKGTINYTFMRQ